MLNSLEKIELNDFEKLEEVVAPMCFGAVFGKKIINVKNNIKDSTNTTINNIFNFNFNFK